MTRENSSEEVILLSLKIKGVSQGKEEDTTYKRVSYWYTVRKLQVEFVWLEYRTQAEKTTQQNTSHLCEI